MRRPISVAESIWLPAGRPETVLLVGALASVAFISFHESITEALRWLLGRESQIPRLEPLRAGRPLKVAVLGSGLAGSTVALWLRDAFGDDGDLDLAVICDGPVGGRCQTIEFEAQKYEAGASIFSEMNTYLLALLRRFALRKWHVSGLHQPCGVFDGTHLVLCGVSTAAVGGWAAAARVLTLCRLAWHFGPWSMWRLQGLASSSSLLNMSGLYRALRDGATFAHPRELLSTLGHNALRLSERSAAHWFQRDLRLPRKAVQELVEPGLRAGFGGQGCAELHAFAGLAGVCGGLHSRCFSVCGGSSLIPERAVEAARPRLLRGTARLVRRRARAGAHEPCFEVAYDASVCGEAMKGSGPSRPSCKAGGREAEGLLVENFHLVVVAHPLEHSVLRFEGCCGDTRERGQHEDNPHLLPFRQSVAHFVHGTLNLQCFFSDGTEDDPQQAAVPSFVPSRVWTTASAGCPFYAISLQFPVSTRTLEEARRVLASAERGVPQVYKILATRQLTEREIDVWFRRCSGSSVKVVDWYAYPQYSAPQSFQPFVLDKAGVFYVNAIEQVVSSMEMSLIGARNVVNLVTDWVGQRRGPRGF